MAIRNNAITNKGSNTTLNPIKKFNRFTITMTQKPNKTYYDYFIAGLLLCFIGAFFWPCLLIGLGCWIAAVYKAFKEGW